MRKSSILTVVILMLFCKVSFADQYFTAKDNETIFAVVSQRELTHLVFKGDVIDSVYSVDGEVEYARRDGKDLFFRMGIAGAKPINLYVKTKAGFVYKMILEPKDIPATQIFVTNQRFLSKKLKREPKGSNLDKKIAQIIKFTRHPKDHLGYKFKNENKKLSKFGSLKRRLILNVEDEFLIAQKIVLTNQSEGRVQLNKQDFIGGWLGCYLDQSELVSGESTILILVGER